MDEDDYASLLVILTVILVIVGFCWFIFAGLSHDNNCKTQFGKEYYSKVYLPFTFPKTIECYDERGKVSIIKVDNNTAQKIKNTPKLIHLRT